MAILLSTYNGERWLTEQLASLNAQTHRDWLLYWRDDGSSDASRSMVEGFDLGGRLVPASSVERLRATGSFLFLLREALKGPASFFAFADQDDVWLPDKLAHAVAALGRTPPDRPALFFCPRKLVDELLRPMGVVPAPSRVPRFPAALTQNLVPGCCMVLNRAAAQAIDALPVPEGAWHDWWSYLVVSARDGVLVAGREPDIQYRQHAGNLVGEPLGFWGRTLGALRRGRSPFMTLFWRQVAALVNAPDLPLRSRALLATIEHARCGGMWSRMRALLIPGFTRQTWAENLIFRIWFLLG